MFSPSLGRKLIFLEFSGSGTQIEADKIRYLQYRIGSIQRWQWGGRGRRMGSSSPPCMILSCPILAPHDGEIFLTPPCPLGPREAPPHPIKLYFLLIFPTTSTIFLMKPISLIKIYLKLQLNLSHQIKSIFRKK